MNLTDPDSFKCIGYSEDCLIKRVQGISNFFRSRVISQKTKYRCENDERIFIFSNLSTQEIHSFNARSGEWEHNGDIVGGHSADVAGVNGMLRHLTSPSCTTINNVFPT